MEVLLKRKADANVKDNVSRGERCEGAPMDGPGVGILGVRIPLLTVITNEGLGLGVKVVVLIRELYGIRESHAHSRDSYGNPSTRPLYLQ